MIGGRSEQQYHFYAAAILDPEGRLASWEDAQPIQYVLEPTCAADFPQPPVRAQAGSQPSRRDSLELPV